MPEQPDFHEEALRVIPYLHVSGVRESLRVLKRELAAAYKRGRREATEGWEREWGLALHGRGASCVLSERDARGIAAGCPDHLKAEVFSRLVGPWEPADQPEEAQHG